MTQHHRSRLVPAALCGALAAGALVAAAPAQAGPATITLGLKDSSIVGAPTTLPAGWYTFTGRSESKDAREFSIARLHDGYSAAQAQKDHAATVKGNLKALFRVLKQTTMVGGAAADKKYEVGTKSATVHLTPGTYVIGDEPVGDSTKSASTVLTVTAGSVGSKPRTTGAILLKDFSFTLQNLKAGSHAYTIANKSPQTHIVSIVSYDNAHTEQDVLQALQSDGPEPSWLTDQGYYGLIGPKQSMVATLNLSKNVHYFFVCFMPDTSMPGMYMPHAAEGMYAFKTLH